jgi:hypothetical protein
LTVTSKYYQNINPTPKPMITFDLRLLAFALMLFFIISAARIRGKLSNRGLGQAAQRQSRRADRAEIASPTADPKQDSFKGILVHYDGPVRFLQPKMNTP